METSKLDGESHLKQKSAPASFFNNLLEQLPEFHSKRKTIFKTKLGQKIDADRRERELALLPVKFEPPPAILEESSRERVISPPTSSPAETTKEESPHLLTNPLKFGAPQSTLVGRVLAMERMRKLREAGWIIMCRIFPINSY